MLRRDTLKMFGAVPFFPFLKLRSKEEKFADEVIEDVLKACKSKHIVNARVTYFGGDEEKMSFSLMIEGKYDLQCGFCLYCSMKYDSYLIPRKDRMSFRHAVQRLVLEKLPFNR